MFDTVVILDARGFIFASEFMRQGYSVVMARKMGKLPGDVESVEYEKEYGKDTICIQKGAIQKGARCIIVDDLIATGGTMRAAESLIVNMGGSVVSSIAPYAITDGSGRLMTSLHFIRFFNTTEEASSGESILYRGE